VRQPQAARFAWTLLLFGSGATSLIYEVVWMRRLGLILGGGAVASAATVGLWMLGLLLGSWAASKIAATTRTQRAYALLEASAAAWALLSPAWMAVAVLVAARWPALAWPLTAVVVVLPTACLGATWPLLARHVDGALAARFYTANTAGAVLGVLASSFFGMPLLGLRVTEVGAALGALGLAWVASELPLGERLSAAPGAIGRVPRVPLAAAFLVGALAMALEVVWFRLAAMALGMTVQNVGLVLAAFLVGVAAGSALGERWRGEAREALAWGVYALGALALGGALLWGELPYWEAAVYTRLGPEGLRWSSALGAVLLMGGAPLASGWSFVAAVRLLPDLDRGAPALYAANTFGGLIGSVGAALWLVPLLGVRGAVALIAGIASLFGLALASRGRAFGALAAAALLLALPAWDGRLYAVGLHLRISDFADPTPAALHAFVDEGWELVSFEHGRTAGVAVGRSTTTGNLWLSVNGKVDASTGDDMATQVLSGAIPVAGSAAPRQVLVVGLASGVTAGAVLRDRRVEHLTVVELEPAVVRASAYFADAAGHPLEDPRTELIVDDARAVLQRGAGPFDVIISEPSNPWITGVSNLFTLEYWELARGRLAPGGVFCQWIQLYGLGTEELRAVVRTFARVFPDAQLFETVPGADVLLVSGLQPGRALPLEATLDPEGVLRLGSVGPLNTDDHPLVEFNAPRWLHYATGARNREVIEGVRRSATEW